MKVESISIQGSNEWNEDALIINEKLGIYGVADGATSLVPYRSKKGETGGRLASQIVKKYFEELDNLNCNSLEELMIRANKCLGAEMTAQGIDISLKDNVWTTGVALLKVDKNYIEFVQTGDCMIIGLYKDQSYRIVTRDQIAYFDHFTKMKWATAIKEGYSSYKEIRKRIEPFIKKQKDSINTIDGYAVLDGSEEANIFLESGKINKIHLEGLIICSDGLFMHDEIDSKAALDPIEKLVKETSIVGLEGYIDYLNALEKKDPECLRFLRTKKSDDKTAIYIKF